MFVTAGSIDFVAMKQAMNNLRSPIFRLARHQPLPLQPLSVINSPDEAGPAPRPLREKLLARQIREADADLPSTGAPAGVDARLLP
jgi:hypothetical protein